jgi:hypothetical protein
MYQNVDISNIALSDPMHAIHSIPTNVLDLSQASDYPSYVVESTVNQSAFTESNRNSNAPDLSLASNSHTQNEGTISIQTGMPEWYFQDESIWQPTSMFQEPPHISKPEEPLPPSPFKDVTFDGFLPPLSLAI